MVERVQDICNQFDQLKNVQALDFMWIKFWWDTAAWASLSNLTGDRRSVEGADPVSHFQPAPGIALGWFLDCSERKLQPSGCPQVIQCRGIRWWPCAGMSGASSILQSGPWKLHHSCSRCQKQRGISCSALETAIRVVHWPQMPSLQILTRAQSM